MLVLSLLNPPGSEGGLSGFFCIFFVFACWFFFNQMLFQKFYFHDQEAMAQFF